MYQEHQWVNFKHTADYDGLTQAKRDALGLDIHPTVIKALEERYLQFKNGSAPYSEYKQSEVNNETSPVTLTTESDADAIIAEYFPEPEPTMPEWQSDQVEIAKEYKRTHRKQQVERQLLKASMLAAVDLSMSTEFTVKIFCDLFPERSHDTITRLVIELWQEGKVKGRIGEEVTNKRKNHSTCFYIITSRGNPKTHYYLQFPKDNPWFQRKKKEDSS